MKITIVGSVSQARRLVDIYNRLKELGHEPQMHQDMHKVTNGTAEQVRDYLLENSQIKKKYDFIKA